MDLTGPPEMFQNAGKFYSTGSYKVYDVLFLSLFLFVIFLQLIFFFLFFQFWESASLLAIEG